jgi:hypothetical protein
MADELSGPYDYYLKTLSDWPTALGSSNQWFLWFDIANVNSLVNELNTKLRTLEGNFGTSGWGIEDDTVLKLIDGQYHFKDRIGCVFAKQVNLPSDGFDAGNEGLSYGGWMPPATANTRTKYQKLRVTFLETNASFVDFVIKPWLVLCSYYGLLSRRNNSNKNVRCGYCDVNFLGRTRATQKQDYRKTYRFHNIVPVSIDSEQYSYMSDDMKTVSVDFVYDQYYIRDKDTPRNLERTM